MFSVGQNLIGKMLKSIEFYNVRTEVLKNTSVVIAGNCRL